MQGFVYLGKSCISELYSQAPDEFNGGKDSTNSLGNFYFIIRSAKRKKTKNTTTVTDIMPLTGMQLWTPVTAWSLFSSEESLHFTLEGVLFVTSNIMNDVSGFKQLKVA